ncbi:MAG: CrcB family protein [Pseudomonadota bacterium]
MALGGALGGVARFLVGEAFDRLFGDGLPWGTLIVNVSGAGLLGYAVATFGAAPAWLIAAIATGGLGSYTTVSSLALQAAVLVEERSIAGAAVYVGLSLVLGLAAVAIGFVFGSA